VGRGVRPPVTCFALTAQSGSVLRRGRERLHAAPGVAPPQARPCLCLRTTVQHTAACAGSVGRVQPRGGPPLTPQVWPPLFPDALHNCYGPLSGERRAGNSRACPASGAPQWECEGRQLSEHVPSRLFTTVGPLHVGIGGKPTGPDPVACGVSGLHPPPREGGLSSRAPLGATPWPPARLCRAAFATPPPAVPSPLLRTPPPRPAAEVAGRGGPAWESLAGRFHL
jgi:hypothetical protein